MFIVNIIVAFIVGLALWCVGSWGLAQIIYRTESRRPEIAGRAYWSAFELVGTLVVFAVSMAIWLGLTYLLQVWTAV